MYKLFWVTRFLDLHALLNDYMYLSSYDKDTATKRAKHPTYFPWLHNLLLLLVRLHDQSSSSDEVGGLLQVLQAPISFLVKRSCWWPLCDSLWLVSVTSQKNMLVWYSSPLGHVGEGTMFSFLCMCALSLLWPERSRAKTTCNHFTNLMKLIIIMVIWKSFKIPIWRNWKENWQNMF